ncbi:hypothetical protein [Paenibacillus herberti]|uniref:DUF2914 domain-containing protein n=1 Tax=Paenibacillus herberti TaxID=1619309 RepID=A0A229NWT5_9BACL|nr:hypothetical protein [Paenibacillus herberti]OXM14360.1 hypothetical protein CGZ75_15550 [Paenibacillus herberti]
MITKKIVALSATSIAVAAITILSSVVFAASPNKVLSNQPSPAVIAANPIKNPNMKIVDSLDEGRLTTLLLGVSVDYNGQGNTGFTYKSVPEEEADKVRVYVKNKGNKSINYKLVSPSKLNWVSTTIEPGQSFITEHNFTSAQAGKWQVKIDNDDGSAGSFDVTVRD